ncbi:MAG: tetratricopeptide repeat protein [Bacteroidales bacterium]|nr:tetratricopeptide repeat protein [Bacteroidales bacterium]
MLSLAILVLLHATTFSQANTNAIFHKSDSLNDLGDTFFDANKYKKAIELYNQAAEMTKEINKGYNTRYATSLESIGLAYSYLGDNKNVLSATPNNGYQFAYWVLEEEGMMYPQYNPLYFEIYPGMEGNYSFTGYFEPISGIDDNTDDDIVIYSLDGCIIVEGADGETVTIYDMTGRIVRDCGLPNGVYMVKVGNRTPRKVVVAR